MTKEIAGELAELAAELESRGLETERVARFIMRCVFSCFAEDVELLPRNLFRRTLETARKSEDPEHLARALTSLWKTMDEGGMYGAEMLHRFNGHFFQSIEALPLEPRDVELLINASRHDWSKVEPSIFGTLLVRALDPEERHRLGAEYTPRAYIERLVEPTVVEPIRERWTAVQAAVLQLEGVDAKKGSSHADVPFAAKVMLRGNRGLSSNGFMLAGSGFLLNADEAQRIRTLEDPDAKVVKAFVNGRDLAQRPRDLFVIDFGLRTEDEARLFPMAFTVVTDRVRPMRANNPRESYATRWWRFAEARPTLREALNAQPQFIASPETTKHRFFVMLDGSTAPDHSVVSFGISQAWLMGVMSSRIHIAWSSAAGSRLGVGDDPRYNKGRCFDAFPFPDPSQDMRDRIARVAEPLDTHRKAAIARDERVTMTGMYNVVEKLRSGEPLTPRERTIHEIAACGVLRDLHDELDALVAEAYGWPWPMEKEEILERLVALHDERVEEEKRGIIRWLRPDYQIPRFAPEGDAPALELERTEKPAAPVAQPARAWPTTAVEQLAALGTLVGQRPVTPDDVLTHFAGAKRDLVARHLETLALMGDVTVDESGRYQVAKKVA